MTQIRPLGWMDTFILSSRLRQVYWDKFDGDGDLQHIRLLDNLGDRLEILEGERAWRGADSFLKRLSAELSPLNNGEPAEFGGAWIERLVGGGKTPWAQIDDDEHFRVYVGLFMPPGACFYCGGDTAVMGVGTINLVNVGALHSRVNFSTAPAVWLVADVRRPPQA